LPDHQLTVLQRERDEWIAHNFPNHTIEDSIFGAVEEMGELVHHYLKRKQGIRGSHEYHSTEMADAVADAIVYLAGVATALGIDYGELVHLTWERVKARDWVADPLKGGES
jgi:NTP pyrophosphatase (non-canonical NTP hydrolase)